MNCEFGTAIIGIIGTLAGVLVGSFIIREREAKSRRREFKAFVAQLVVESKRQIQDFPEFYFRKSANLQYAAMLIMDDFPENQRKQFRDLVSIATNFTGADASVHTGIKKIRDSFEAIGNFIGL